MEILLVEDSLPFREAVKKIIAQNMSPSPMFHECETGEGAVALFDSVLPDLTVMDIKLKSGDGLTAAKNIYRTHPDAKIIVLTQYKESVYREEAKSMGAVAFVLKDNLSELPQIILRSLAHSGDIFSSDKSQKPTREKP